MNKIMKIALDKARYGIRNNEGGPFGAVIVDSNGNIISTGNNRVIIDKDPTAHAEVVAIRRACAKLKTYDLTGYILYTSCEPCPMCLSAIIWSNIKVVYYALDKRDAQNIGFRDDIIYNYLENRESNLLDMHQIDHDDCMDVFREYQDKNGTIY